MKILFQHCRKLLTEVHEPSPLVLFSAVCILNWCVFKTWCSWVSVSSTLPCFLYWCSPAEDTMDESIFCWASGNPGRVWSLHGPGPLPKHSPHLQMSESLMMKMDAFAICSWHGALVLIEQCGKLKSKVLSMESERNEVWNYIRRGFLFNSLRFAGKKFNMLSE